MAPTFTNHLLGYITKVSWENPRRLRFCACWPGLCPSHTILLKKTSAGTRKVTARPVFWLLSPARLNFMDLNKIISTHSFPDNFGVPGLRLRLLEHLPLMGAFIFACLFSNTHLGFSRETHVYFPAVSKTYLSMIDNYSTTRPDHRFQI